jgi:PAS domain S-box-containing protein
MTTSNTAAQSALRDPLQLYQDLVETSQDLIWQCDSEGRYTYLNPAWETTFGYTIKEMLGRKFTDFQTPEFAERDMQEFARLMQGGVLKGLETIHIGQTGQQIHLVFNAKHIVDDNGKIIGTRGTAHDITERKMAEKKTKDTLDLINKIARYVPGVLYQYRLRPDGTSHFPYISEAVREFSQYGPEEIYQDTSRTFGNVLPEDYDAFVASIQVSARDLSPWRHEYRMRIGDGPIRTIFGNALPQREEDGSVVWHGFVLDITDRKRSEAALRESESIFQQFMDNSPIYVFFKDEEIRTIRLSKNFEKMLGKPMSELLGKTMDDLFPSDLAKSMVADDLRILREGKVVTVDEELNGRMYTTIKFPIHIDGKPRYLAGYVIDITERKLADAKLLQAKKYSENLIETANAIVVGLDVAGQVNVFNRTAEEITGFSRADLEGRNWFEVLVPRERYPHVWQEFERLTHAGIPTIFENPILTKHGQERYISWQNAVLSEDGRTTGTISFGIDITDRKNAEAKLRYHLAELKASNDELTRFNRVATNRELRMIDLKREINNLCGKLGLPPRYTVAVDLDSPEEGSGPGEYQLAR